MLPQLFIDGVLKEIKVRGWEKDVNLAKEGKSWTLLWFMYADDAVLVREDEEIWGLVVSGQWDDQFVVGDGKLMTVEKNMSDCSVKIDRGGLEMVNKFVYFAEVGKYVPAFLRKYAQPEKCGTKGAQER